MSGHPVWPVYKSAQLLSYIEVYRVHTGVVDFDIYFDIAIRAKNRDLLLICGAKTTYIIDDPVPIMVFSQK